jgi:NAD(P)H-flavin reductase/ferredoxin
VTHEVHLAGTEITFGCRDEQTVLDAAERAGWALPYSCRKGVCSSCEATVTAGIVRVPGRGELTGPASGVRLCRAVPRTSVEIDPAGVERRDPPARRVITATVHKISYPVPDVAVLSLRYPIGKRVPFQAGQYLTVRLPDGDTRNYSLANPPQRNDQALLHVRRLPGGRFSDVAIAGLRRGDRFTVEVPFGQFTLDHADSRPILLVVTGTGFAPAKSIVEELIHHQVGRAVHLYWGARRRRDLYLAELPARWATRYPWFRFTPVLSEPSAGWTGRSGHVHRVALDDYPELSDHEVYACGNPAMTAAAGEEFPALAGLPPGRFHSDAFLPSGEPDPVTSR